MRYYFSDSDQEMHDEYVKRFTDAVAKKHGSVTKEHTVIIEMLAHQVVKLYRRERMEVAFARAQYRTSPDDPTARILELTKELGLIKGSE